MTALVLIPVLAALLCIPVGLWIHAVMNRKIAWISRQEDWILAHLGISSRSMSWKKYLFSLLALSALSFVIVYVLLLACGQSWDLAFNTAVSFVTNTNWQAADPAFSIPWWCWIFGLGVQMFVSAAVGISVLFAFIRGLIHTENGTVGNFWQDLTGSVLYILLPLNLVAALLLGAGGLPMNLNDSRPSALMEPVVISQEGDVLPQAAIQDGKIILDGKELEGATVVDEQLLPSGPYAAIEAIKQSGSNGGGLTGANSASPFENPNGWTNLLENLMILHIPMSLCVSFGAMIRNRKQGAALFGAMAILFVCACVLCLWPELSASNMLGKESRFGIEASSLWAVSTTAVSSGSASLSMTGLTPLGSMIPMILMQTGEVVFGGVGTGLLAMAGFVILTVFLAGLMVGRTPEFLGKKIEPYEMKMSVILCICAPACILVGSALGSIFVPDGLAAGPHGFSQILYAWTSQGANNGSAMAGFESAGILMNILGALMMIAGRFVPLYAGLAIAGSLGAKKKTPASAGTLATDTPLFTLLLVIVILLIGALSFFPALALGPLAQFFG